MPGAGGSALDTLTFGAGASEAIKAMLRAVVHALTVVEVLKRQSCLNELTKFLRHLSIEEQI